MRTHVDHFVSIQLRCSVVTNKYKRIQLSLSVKDYYLYISCFDVTESGLTEAVDKGLVVHQFHLLGSDLG